MWAEWMGQSLARIRAVEGCRLNTCPQSLIRIVRKTLIMNELGGCRWLGDVCTLAKGRWGAVLHRLLQPGEESNARCAQNASEASLHMKLKKSSEWLKDLRRAARIDKDMTSSLDDSGKTDGDFLRRLRRMSNAEGWSRFAEIYTPLIARSARKAGLSEDETEELVQTTMTEIAKRFSESFDYDPSRGKFRAWLYGLVKWRVADALRARYPDSAANPKNVSSNLEEGTEPGHGHTAPWEPGVSVFEQFWREQWNQQLIREALDQARKKVSAAHFQIFSLHVIDEIPARKVAEMVGVGVARVHLVKFRVREVVRRQLESLLAQENAL